MATSIEVVIPTYNDDSRLALALWGYTQQTDQDFELHVVNDGGDPETEALVRSYRDRLCLHYHYLEPPTAAYRPSAARNLGLTHCRATRIICTDCDTVPAPELVAAHRHRHCPRAIIIGPRQYINEAAVAGLTYAYSAGTLTYATFIHEIRQSDERGFNAELKETFARLHYPALDTYDYNQNPAFYHYCHSCNISYEAAVVRRLGGFCTNYDGVRFGEDHDLAARLLLAGGAVSAIHVPVYHLDHPPRAPYAYAFCDRQLAQTFTNPDLARNGALPYFK